MRLCKLSLMSVGAEWERVRQAQTQMGEKGVYVKLTGASLLVCLQRATNNASVVFLKLLDKFW